MPIKTIIYLVLFCSTILGGILYNPIICVYGYIAAYNVNPLQQWWGDFLPVWASRYSMILSISIAAGVWDASNHAGQSFMCHG